jgi:hypothetical protein
MKPVDARKEENSEAVCYNLCGSYVEETFGKQKYRVGESLNMTQSLIKVICQISLKKYLRSSK